jgi:hypothetical protein
VEVSVKRIRDWGETETWLGDGAVPKGSRTPEPVRRFKDGDVEGWRRGWGPITRRAFRPEDFPAREGDRG